jgi:hypothetical protein
VTLEQLVQDPAAGWTRAARAPAEAIELLAAGLPDLPPDYLAFLRLSNGGEGPLPADPGWFQLWPAEEVVSLNAAYKVADFLPGYVAFGSDGGAGMLAFGARPESWGRVFVVPFIPMSPEAVRPIATDFAALARTFGRREPRA